MSPETFRDYFLSFYMGTLSVHGLDLRESDAVTSPLERIVGCWHDLDAPQVLHGTLHPWEVPGLFSDPGLDVDLFDMSEALRARCEIQTYKVADDVNALRSEYEKGQVIPMSVLTNRGFTASHIQMLTACGYVPDPVADFIRPHCWE